MSARANATAREGYTARDGQARVYCEMDERDRITRQKLLRSVVTPMEIASGTRVRVEGDHIVEVVR